MVKKKVKTKSVPVPKAYFFNIMLKKMRTQFLPFFRTYTPKVYFFRKGILFWNHLFPCPRWPPERFTLTKQEPLCHQILRNFNSCTKLAATALGRKTSPHPDKSSGEAR